MSAPRLWRVPPTGAAAGDPGYAKAIAAAAAALREGLLVAFPTETVYGLGADGLDAAAVRRIYAAKGRPADNPVILHVASEEEARALAAVWPPLAARAAAAFWPGPLTLVVPRGPRVPDEPAAGLPTVALRCPAHPVALDLIRATGRPLAAPSANRSGRPSPTTAAHVLEDLGPSLAGVLDAGPCPVGVESTVVDVSGTRPVLLRPGGLPLEQLEAVLGPVEAPEAGAEQAPRAPGMKYRHYAPRARLVVVEAAGLDVVALERALRAAALPEVQAGRLPGFLVPSELAGQGWPGPVTPAGPHGDGRALAASLFAGLRALDALGVDVIVAFLPEPRGLGRAVRNRLLKAAARVIPAALTAAAGPGGDAR